MVSKGAALRRRFFRLGRLILFGSILLLTGTISAFTTMRLVIRSGDVQVPQLVGKKMVEARNILAGRDLGLKTLGERYDDKSPAGTILLQSPGAGTHVKGGRDVRVLVSLGARAATTPNLEGATIRAARIMLEETGFQLGDVGFISSNTPASEIIAQTPEPDTKEIVDRRVGVLVSTGNSSNRFVMPDFVGQELNQVIASLEKYGLKVGNVTYRAYENLVRGIVAKQSPEAGFPVTENSTVHLEVSK